MKKIKCIVLLLCVILANSLFAQMKRANKYYENYDYAKAIPLYKKAVKRKATVEALEKLANSYRQVKDYKNAELVYAELMKQPNFDVINHFYYGLVLKNTGKIEDAKEQFKIYTNAAPNDKVAQLSVKSCDDIKMWITKTQQFEVSLIPNVNSVHSDFSPVYYKDQMVFVSERTKDMVNNNKFERTEQPYLNVYASTMKTGAGATIFSKSAKPFSSTINTNYHDGPVCFNTEQNTMYLTRVNYVVNKDKDFVNRPGIYISTLKGKKWSKAKAFQYNNDAYSVAHPSVSADGQWLFFSSDMPGGQGGMDIYVCRKNGEGWDQPKNLGSEVNTPGNEVFPYIRKDGALYFSSDGHPGFGGLDVFSATKRGDSYAEVKNLGAPLNAYTDDFGIVFSDDINKGYFSSDRAGGVGSDDIYSFTALNKFITVSGKILLSKNVNDPAKNTEVMLLGDDGKVLKVTNTDNSGFFKFENLDPDGKYMVKLDETDPQLANKKKYYLADENDHIIRVTVINDKGGKFVFQNLPADPNSLPQLQSDDDVTIAGNLLYGENPSMPLANTKVNLVNDKGEVIQTVNTNAFGAFVFTNLPSDQNFLVKVEESDTKLAPNTKIIITNKSGKEMQTTTAGNTGSFKFSFLSADKNTLKLMSVEDNELRFDLKGKLISDTKSPLANSVINIVNEKGEVLQSVKTDANGAFQFTNLPADQNILFALEENDTKLKTFNKLYLTDSKGNVIKEFVRVNGKFKFTVLPTDQNKLGVVYVDDPWLKVLQLKNEAKRDSLTIVENVYYNYGEYKILPEAEKTLDKVINIMKNDAQLVIELSSHTDSRSSSDYNMKLSQQRAKAAVDYMLARGVSKERISGKGYGESRLINKCADGVECTEEEHSKNRRTEFKILRKQR
ncbi:MAG: flagellar motor protein MotB [Bacteroidetes bacterium]|nr:flagellar motor protein MotB [Bacteroidota bacterium]